MIFNEQRFSCSSCPCLNNDYEYGPSCNLGYDCDSRWNEKKELHSTSKNCELISVNFKEGIFIRSEKSNWTDIHPNGWDIKQLKWNNKNTAKNGQKN